MWVKPSLEKNSAWVEDKMTVATIKNKLGNGTIVHIVFDKSFSTIHSRWCYIVCTVSLNISKNNGMYIMFQNSLWNIWIQSNGDMLDILTTCSITALHVLKLTSLDVSNFNTKKVTNMSFMFSYCSTLTTIYVNDKFVIDKVTNGSYMLITQISKDYAPSKKDHNYAKLQDWLFHQAGRQEWWWEDRSNGRNSCYG